jgi:hypothetical protein
MNGNQLSLLIRSYNYGFVRNFCLHGRFYGLIDRIVTSGWTCTHVFVRASPGRQCICWTLPNLWFSFLGFWVRVSSATRAVPLLDPDSKSGTMFPSRGKCHRTAIPATMAGAEGHEEGGPPLPKGRQGRPSSRRRWTVRRPSPTTTPVGLISSRRLRCRPRHRSRPMSSC